YLKQYEQHGYPIFRHEMAAITCRELLGLPLSELAPEFIEYIDSRRRANGSFNNTPAADGSDGHVLNTRWGLQALRVLGRAKEKQQETIEWLQSCKLANGGFTYQPNAKIGGVDDVAYTWAAVRALKQLGTKPVSWDGCLHYLHSLWNEDGGFGDRPGRASNPMATFYALGAMDELEVVERTQLVRAGIVNRPGGVPNHLKVFTIQIEAHGTGSPTEAVELARTLRIHMWGAKN